ncbi:hypothetical protein GPECTOR_4g900 [Gonium pectorale]|uniref:EF-hand domain-containing protein n=1 Tax=Gonium pectorale TaxID=33097 RepID=A0A150GYB1_GONPE|nr:hypothetical protein GPECTOR_4g900 [Gonium pectorale]|eukprot:KXZ54829.1 hypothetical protein GPECTOR_4g900 [Gonium pectorale]
MLGLNQKQLDAELQMTQRVGRRSLSYEEFMSACEAMVALHGALAQQQVRRLPNNDMSQALRSAFNMYVKLNVGGFVGGDQRMNSNQFVKMCQDAGMMEPNGPASMATLQISWASCKATFGSTRLQYSQFLKVMGALAAELSGDVFLLVAGLGLQLPTVPPLRNGFRKPDAGELNVPKPEMMQGMGAHMLAEEAYEKYVQEGRMPDKDRRGDPLGRGAASSPMKTRPSGGGVPNWVKAMQADQGGVGPMTSGQDIRGIPIIEAPDSDDDMPRKPPPRKQPAPSPPPDEPMPMRAKASPMKPRGKLPAMGGDDVGSTSSPSIDPELVIRAEGPNYGGPGARTDVLSAPVAVRPRDSVRNGITIDPDSPVGPLEPNVLPAPPRMRKTAMAPEGFREVVEQQAAAVKTLETKVAEQQEREKELFERVQMLTEKLVDAQAIAAVTVQTGCPGAPLPDVPEAKGRKVVSGRCPLTDQVEKLTEQMAEVLARLSALESIRMQPKNTPTPPSQEPPAKQRNPIGLRTPDFEEGALIQNGQWPGPTPVRSKNGGPEAPAMVSALEPANGTQGEWMSRMLLNLDKRVRVLEGSAGKDPDADGEALAEVLKQLRGMQQMASPAPPAPPAPGTAISSVPDPAFLKVDPKRKMEKVPDSNIDLAPALAPTGDPELDRRLAALANDLRSKHATVGLLLDMLNQTRGEVSALAAQVAELQSAGASGPVVVGQKSPTGQSVQQRNAIRVVDGGLVPHDGVGGLAPPIQRVGGAAPLEAIAPLEPQLEAMLAEQHGLKRAVRELCAAVGVTPPPAAAPAPEMPATAITVVAQEPPAEVAPWGQPGRKALKEETQEVKRNVESVQTEVVELKKQVEQMRAVAGFGEWPTPLRPEAAAATMAVAPGMAPVQAVGPAGGRNSIQVMVGAPTLTSDPLGLPPGRKPLPLGAEAAIPALPDAQLSDMKSELRRLQAFVGMPEAVPAAGAAAGAVAMGAAAPAAATAGGVSVDEAGKWADAGKGPQPLKDAVTTVASDVESLRKHVKAMDAALRTNIGNVNNLTSYINDHAPILAQAKEQAEKGGAGGRNPIMVTPGELQQPGMQAQGKRPLLPLQDGNFEAAPVDPVEYQKLRDQVRSMAHFLGMPADGGGAVRASPAPPAPASPGQGGSAVTVVSSQGDWASAGRGGMPGGQTLGMTGPAGRGSNVADGLNQVSGEVEMLKKQVAQMGFTLTAAGLSNPAAAADGAAAGGAEAIIVGQRQKNPIMVTPGGASVDGSGNLVGPGRRSQAGMEGGVPVLEAEVGALKADVRAMKQFLCMEEAGPGQKRGGALVVGAVGVPPGSEAEKAAAGQWGDKGRGGVFTRDTNDVDKIQIAATFGNLGDMARDIDFVKRKQSELEETMLRMADGMPGGAAGQGDGTVKVPGDGADAARRQRNPITVTPGMVEPPNASGFNAPKRPLQPLQTIEGVPEPVLHHLGALEDDVKRVTAFLGIPSVAAPMPSPAPPAPPQQQSAAPLAPTPPAAPQPWGTAPPPRQSRGGTEEAPKVEKLSDLVKEVQVSRERQEGMERVFRAMGVQIPWGNEMQPAQMAVAQAPAAATQQEVQAQRQRNPIQVMAGSMQDGATGFAPPTRKLQEPVAGMPEALPPVLVNMADEIKRVQAFLGMAPAPALIAAVGGAEAVKPAQPGAASGEARPVPAAAEPWGTPGRERAEPRQPGEEPKNYGEVVREVDYTRRRMGQMEEALRSAGISLSPPPEAPASAVSVGGSQEQQAAQRQRNAISVTPGLMSEGATGFAPPGRKPLPALAGLPEPAQAELTRMADDFKRMQAFLAMAPPVTVAGQVAGAEAPRTVGAVGAGGGAGDGRGGVSSEPWGVPGREPRAPGQEPSNIGEMVREMDYNRRRMVELEDAMRAAGIPVPPPGGADGQGPMQVGGLPEPAQAELSRLADDVKRMNAFLAMAPPAAVAGQAAGAETVKVMGGAGGAGDARGGVTSEPWGFPGREPRAPGQEPSNIGEIVRELDYNRKRMVELEDAMRAAGIPVPPAGGADGQGPVQVGGTAEEQRRQRNAIAVTPGLSPDGATGFGPPGRKTLPALAGLPEPAQAELSRLADDVKRMQAFLAMAPPATVAGQAAGAETVKVMGGAGGAGDARGGVSSEPWGVPGREPRAPGQEPSNIGEMVRDIDHNRRRVIELEDAMRAAGIPVPPSGGADGQGSTQVGGSVEEQQRRQRNAIAVTPGLMSDGATGFAPPARKPGPALAGELARDADNNRRRVIELEDALRAAGVNMPPPAAASTAVAGAPAEQQAAQRQRNAIAVMPGMMPEGASGFAPPSRPSPALAGEVVRDNDDTRKRIVELEQAMRAAGLPLPSRGADVPEAAVSGGATDQQQYRQRNAIAVTPGLAPEGAAGFAAPGRKLPSLAGLPDPAQAELSRMADDIKRVQAFLGMGPPGTVAGQAAGAEAVKAAGGAGGAGDGRGVSSEPWGVPGRDPRALAQEPRSLGEVVRDTDDTRKRIIELEDAMRAAGIPVPPPGGAAPGTNVSGSTEQAQRQRNAIAVTPGLAPEGATGFAPPGRKLPAPAGFPEPAQAELARIADDLKRVQAFLGMGPPAAAASAPGAEAVKVAGSAGGDGRGAGSEPWGAPGREPRQPGQEPKTLPEVVKDLDDYKQRVVQLEEALRAAGIPIPPPPISDPTGVGASPAAAQRQRNGIVVSPGLVQSNDGSKGFAAPKRGQAGPDVMPESLPARVDSLQDDVKKIKAFVGIPDAAIGTVAAGPDAAKAAGAAAASTEAGPWAGPGREKGGAAPSEQVAKDVEDVKKQLDNLERALRGAGMGYMLPKEGGAAAPEAVQQQDQRADDKQRSRIAVVDGGLQRPQDASGFAPLETEGRLAS